MIQVIIEDVYITAKVLPPGTDLTIEVYKDYGGYIMSDEGFFSNIRPGANIILKEAK